MSTWTELQKKFSKLIKEETKAIRFGLAEQPLGVIVDRSDPENKWKFELTHGPAQRDYFREKFKQTATDAGVLLGIDSRNVTGLELWIDGILKHCRLHSPAFIFADNLDSGGGYIKDLCEASATFCAWLNRRQIDIQTRGEDGELHYVVKDAVEYAFAKHAMEQMPEASPSATNPDTSSSPSNCPHRAEVDAFLRAANATSTKPIRRRHIWLLVGHSKARQFEYWQACDTKRTTRSDEKNFSRTLREGPEKFIQRLRAKKLI